MCLFCYAAFQRFGRALLVADATGAGRTSSPPAALEEIRKNLERLQARTEARNSSAEN